MIYDKSFLRNKYSLIRERKHLKTKKFNFNLIFKIIKKHFKNKKIIIAGYFPSNYEVDVLKFLKEASKRKFKIVLPVIKASNNMCFKLWPFKEPLYINKFGILEPKDSKKEIVPDLILVPLLAFDSHLNRLGYGKGYYDRSLAKVSKIKKNIISLGVAYSFQKHNYIPHHKYDFKLDYIFTEQRIISSR